ncbi:MAG: hypothetical protein MUF60_03845, partial [Vicinamibacterales bacterium]|nr:hypothetical protein [Vicinamibacterales bacterium]
MMPNRLSALLSAAAAALVLSVAPAAGASPSPQAAAAPAPVRLALVGAWHVHTNGFLNRIAQMNAGQVEWIAVWDQDPARGKQFAGRLGVPF